ncbi:LIM-domain-containing protein [Desarmillaria tabescens]|uniref:Cysteine-rich protein 1 n=1 Tax=Armillaria tabescens TaxID=1929756 RepID=A0AA39NCX6_ARMTA|nr:LIM-domain-containing protein [Desarmillaria tabescens]KAK0463193.1 LIM-domain-containing protein [Desarmillaria tabescens]
MHPFGGTTICPRCEKAVYAAEQVMGPGRKASLFSPAYPAPCLKCSTCNKRLDSYTLLEHDQEPYWYEFVTFGTRDLRQANLPYAAPPSPTRANTDTKDSEEQAEEEKDTLNDLTPSPTKDAATLQRSNTLDAIGRTAKPLIQTSTGTRYGAALGMVSPQTTGRKWGGASTTPRCPKCNGLVYFAEQVKAVGKTYHKACLRCMECNTLLDSTRLRDHDGTPLCGRCYSKLHGPQGSGYALLGKAGG